jgi:phage shock protein PspC (stress-responsive transcriptional regulator)
MAELRRPIDGKVIAGVCAGIADRFGIGRNTVRVIAVVSCLLPGPQFLLYVILWIAIPAEQPAREPAPTPTSAK